jgi:hypothetical protein
MASGVTFDPLKLLRVSPLLLSTSTLTYAWCENFFYGAFLATSHRRESNAVLPGYLNYVVPRSVPGVVFHYALTAILAGANVYAGREQLSRVFYGLGAAFTLTHFAFVPAVIGPLQRIMADSGPGKSTEEMEEWLWWHRIRLAVADVPAWLSYAGAVLCC